VTQCSTVLEQLPGTRGIGNERYDNELIALVNAADPLVSVPAGKHASLIINCIDSVHKPRLRRFVLAALVASLYALITLCEIVP
jgi:hypothetical protein